MRRAIFRALMLGLWRDRGALVMSFVLPVAVFLVFAAIFSGASGDALRLRVAIADEVKSPMTLRLVTALTGDPSLRPLDTPDLDKDDVAALVAAGRVDAGIVIRRDGRSLDDLTGDGPAPVVVLTHPIRGVAGSIIAGTVQRVYFAALPDAALRGVVTLVDTMLVELTEAQRETAAAQLVEIAAAAGASDGQPRQETDTVAFDRLVETETSRAGDGALDQVAYYAGAVAALFVLLSAVHAAASIHEDVDAGIVERVIAGPAGVQALVDGRAMFLVVQGILQAVVIFTVAWATFGVSLPASLAPWLLVTIALAMSSSGLMLAVATLARTARQAHTASNVLILIASAVGGSMVPRFLMPPWLQQVGWSSPNAWAIEGYSQAFNSTQTWSGVATPVVVLVLVGGIGWFLAGRFARRWETI